MYMKGEKERERERPSENGMLITVKGFSLEFEYTRKLPFFPIPFLRVKKLIPCEGKY